MDYLIGTYTIDTKAKGLYRIRATTDGLPRCDDEAIALTNPSFLIRHPTLAMIYVVCEIGTTPGGILVALRLDEAGDWQQTQEVSTHGLDPCHLAISPDGQWLAISHYSSGSFLLLGLDEQGAIGSRSWLTSHAARYLKVKSRDGRKHPRQQAAHVHAAYFLDTKRLLVCDLGTDEVVLYSLPMEESASVIELGAWSLPPGSGPRHAALSVDGQQIYVVAELSNEVFRLKMEKNGTLSTRNMGSCLPPGRQGFSEAAEIHLDEARSSVWVSNRGLDSVVQIPLTSQARRSGNVAWQCGAHPRHFWMDASVLVIAARDDHVVQFIPRDTSGRLLLSRQMNVEVPSPVCILPLT